MKLARRWVVTGCVIIVLMTLYPPWLDTLTVNGGGTVESPKGYYSLVSPPLPKKGSLRDGVSIDFGRLFLQWWVVAIVFGGIAYIRRPD